MGVAGIGAVVAAIFKRVQMQIFAHEPVAFESFQCEPFGPVNQSIK